MYIYIHIHIYTHTYVYVYTYIDIYIYRHIHICIYMCIYTYIHTYTHIYIYIYIHIYIHTRYIHTHTYIYIHTHIYILCVCVLSHFRCVWPFLTRWTLARQAPLSMGFSRQEYFSRLPCPAPGDLPDPGVEPMSLTFLALAGGFFTTRATWEAPCILHMDIQVFL